jgi:hypothetical protein
MAGQTTVFECRVQLAVSFAGIVVTVETELRGRGREELGSRAAVRAVALRARLHRLVECFRAPGFGKVVAITADFRLRSSQQGLVGRHVRIVARDAIAVPHGLVDPGSAFPQVVFDGVALLAFLRHIFDLHAALVVLSVADGTTVFGQGTVEPGANQRPRLRSVGRMAIATRFDGNRQTAVGTPPLAVLLKIMALCAGPSRSGDVVVDVGVVAGLATVV